MNSKSNQKSNRNSNQKRSIRFEKLAAIAFGCVAFAGAAANASFAQAAQVEQVEQVASAVTSISQSDEAAQASVPRLVQFNGTLKDSAARPVSGVASVTFAIYAEQDGGAALWSETQNVLADANGHYSVLLGAATAHGVPSELFGTGQSRWLGVTIARQQEIPRVLLASVPYALKAADADTLGGLPASAYVTTQSLAASNAKTAPSSATFTGGNTTIVATPLASSTPAASLAPSGIPQATPTGSGTTDFIPIWTSSSALGNSTIFESAGQVGIGTTTPAQTLDVHGNSIFRGSFQLAPENPATASTGYASHSFQFEASSYNSSTKVSDTEAFGFRAEPLGNNTSAPSAKLDLFYGPGGGTLTDTGLSFADNGIITFASGQTFDGTSENLSGSISFPLSSSTSPIISVGGYSFVSDYGDITSTFVGAAAGPAARDGAVSNTGFGYGTLLSLTNGLDNTAAGVEALEKNSTGNGNSAVGVIALGGSVTGNANSALGEEALYSNISGSQNVGVGNAAGFLNNSGSDDTFIGTATAVSVDGLNNATAIGANAEVGASNSMVLGSIDGVNHATASVSVGIGTTTPQSALDVRDNGTGNGAITAQSPTVGRNAIYGINTATSGTSNGGVFVTDSAAGSGIVAINNVSGGLAAYLQGNVTVTGTLTKGGGSFKIDDPIDPAGKYLSHSFVESPDMMNIYNGIATLDAHGTAVIEMPEWFGALNRDFRYQLTAIGAPGPKLYISEKMKGNRFKIAGGKKGQEISWQVTGIRQDAWANAHRIPTEEAKPANEQGRYLHPELYGAPAEMNVSAQHGAASAAANTPGQR
jgi:hypothetical protein